MTREEIINGLKMSIDLMLFDPTTGEVKEPHQLNDMDRTSYEAFKGAMEILAQPQTKCIAKITLSKEQIQDAVEKAKREILDELPRWIPVTERLPEKNMWTICQNNAGAMMIGKYDIEFGWMFPAYFDGIVAWQPCPAPFKGGSHMNEVDGPAADADQ